MKKTAVIIILLAVIGAAWFFLFPAKKQTASQRPVRIVFITLDTLRYDTFMGDPKHDTQMPLTWAFARNGRVFSHFYSATSTTQPSHATFFTGRQPWEHGVIGNGQKLSAGFTTFPELLQQNGFATYATVASFPLSSKMGFSQGFDQYVEDFDNKFSGKEHEGYSLANSIVAAALRQIDNAAGKKQFFWFHFFDAHEPYGNTFDAQQAVSSGKLLYKAVKSGRTATEIANIVDLNKCREFYNRDVNYLDKFLAKLLTRITADQYKFETHIVVVSDHGEGFGEEGSVAHSRRISYPLIHVPLFVVSPKFKGKIDDHFVSSLDIMPTILDMAGIVAQKTDGHSLLKPPSENEVVWGMRRVFDKPYREPRLDGKFHLLDKYLFYTITPEGQLLRGNKDKIVVGEINETGAKSDYYGKVKRIFAEYEQELLGQKKKTTPDRKTIERLKGLGYVQ